MKLFFVVILFLLFARCATSKHSAQQDIPFQDVQFTLVSGKIGDSTIHFSTEPSHSFVVKFGEKNFRSFDGRFSIRGTAKDTASVYYTDFPFTGFFNKVGGSVIAMQWFRNISWSFHFQKNPTRQAIARIFSIQGIYTYDGSQLLFFRETGNFRDTAIVLTR